MEGHFCAISLSFHKQPHKILKKLCSLKLENVLGGGGLFMSLKPLKLLATVTRYMF